MKKAVLVTCVMLSIVFCRGIVRADFEDEFDSYADGDLDVVSGGTWVKAGGPPIYPLKIKTVGGSKVASQYQVNDYRGATFLHYAPVSNNGMPASGADYTVSVDIDIDGDTLGGITDDGSFGIVGRLQSNTNYVYAYIMVDVPSNAASTATLWLQRNGKSIWWVNNVPISYLNDNQGHIKMTLSGEKVHIEANWGTTYSKTEDFFVSGSLLNAGPAGLNASDWHGNAYYVMGNFRNFSVVAEPWWSDDFNVYYGTYDHLEEAVAWSATHTGIFKTQADGRIYHYLGTYGNTTRHIMQADAVGELADATVTVEAQKHPSYSLIWQVLGRISGSDFVYASAYVSGGNVNVSIGDSANTGSPVVAGSYSNDLPIVISLNMEGSDLTATVSHDDWTNIISTTTAIVAPGYTGFAGKGVGAYPIGYFDNFEVTLPPPPQGTVIIVK